MLLLNWNVSIWKILRPTFGIMLEKKTFWQTVSSVFPVWQEKLSLEEEESQKGTLVHFNKLNLPDLSNDVVFYTQTKQTIHQAKMNCTKKCHAFLTVAVTPLPWCPMKKLWKEVLMTLNIYWLWIIAFASLQTSNGFSTIPQHTKWKTHWMFHQCKYTRNMIQYWSIMWRKPG